jgi:hypothetical protein
MPLYYREGSEGNCSTRKPLFVLTHGQETDGAWDTSTVADPGDPSGVVLRVELTAEDVSGNATVAAMYVTVVP